ncbi:MAG: hypothetical protein B6U69_01135 [Thermofilum sp. ex4484_15]|nr:MAG: hypothetical protein B6U69_01135 [Thermofilum sp. ex4484_15]
MGLRVTRTGARNWLEELDIWDYHKIACWKLSGGTKRKVLLAVVLTTGAGVLFLDEPTIGLDIKSKYKVWRALRNIVFKGRTILLTTHDMAEAEMLADEVIMLNKGLIVGQGAPKELIAKVGYSYRVIIIKGVKSPLKRYKEVDLGNRKIIYVKKKDEIVEILMKLNFKGEVKVEE